MAKGVYLYVKEDSSKGDSKDYKYHFAQTSSGCFSKLKSWFSFIDKQRITLLHPFKGKFFFSRKYLFEKGVLYQEYHYKLHNVARVKVRA